MMELQELDSWDRQRWKEERLSTLPWKHGHLPLLLLPWEPCVTTGSVQVAKAAAKGCLYPTHKLMYHERKKNTQACKVSTMLYASEGLFCCCSFLGDLELCDFI